ncbi:hypothetical protein AB0I72_08095 [Nocardiopsis sp. NPDC049922]|uniref:hypothetical protein n=1 Tax=Nocardiopsis sp. NPDC049922 TaxID=3155157 RepID=UPI003407EC55
MNTHRLTIIRNLHTCGGVEFDFRVLWGALTPPDDLGLREQDPERTIECCTEPGPDQADRSDGVNLIQLMDRAGYDRVDVDGTDALFADKFHIAVWGLELLSWHSDPNVAAARHARIDLATGDTLALG